MQRSLVFSALFALVACGPRSTGRQVTPVAPAPELDPLVGFFECTAIGIDGSADLPCPLDVDDGETALHLYASLELNADRTGVFTMEISAVESGQPAIEPVYNAAAVRIEPGDGDTYDLMGGTTAIGTCIAGTYDHTCILTDGTVEIAIDFSR
ncbi:MAG: hypothetical protein H6734_13445 [Alphaproteobacteria bacterium]|nr:hypothetical protein [Alphaproteobacteria bacterium]